MFKYIQRTQQTSMRTFYTFIIEGKGLAFIPKDVKGIIFHINNYRM